jgi:hypothetical protein
MSQNLITLNLTDADFLDIDKALTELEQKLIELIDLQTSERRAMPKMGQKSEAFCRQRLAVLAQNPQMIPASMNLADAQKIVWTAQQRARLLRWWQEVCLFQDQRAGAVAFQRPNNAGILLGTH